MGAGVGLGDDGRRVVEVVVGGEHRRDLVVALAQHVVDRGAVRFVERTGVHDQGWLPIAGRQHVGVGAVERHRRRVGRQHADREFGLVLVDHHQVGQKAEAICAACV